ncbi:MAG: XRE family transcriptional regulator [Proteobacteria bacterium]|nr:MAG: XRE family transcriptional regulator [Pseudomonadota bacterium]
MNSARVGIFLRDQRQRNNLTIQQVAAETDLVTPEELKAIEAGDVTAPMDVILALINIIGIDANEVLELFYDVMLSTTTRKESTN